MYPENWPKCHCGQPCMDGKSTCGNVECKLVAGRPGTLTVGAFVKECGRAMGFSGQTRCSCCMKLVEEAPACPHCDQAVCPDCVSHVLFCGQ